MEGDFFKYLSMVEGLMIVCMLGWEIYWLRRMYQVLGNMPTSDQLREMIEMIKKDRDSIKDSVKDIYSVFDYGKKALSVLVSGNGNR